jgi:hypothetical protein
MGWLESVERDGPWLTMALQRFAEECLCGGDVPRTAQVRFHRFRHSAMTGLRRARTGASPRQNRRNIGQPNAESCREPRKRQFAHDLGEIPVTEFESQIPLHAADDGVIGEPVL